MLRLLFNTAIVAILIVSLPRALSGEENQKVLDENALAEAKEVLSDYLLDMELCKGTSVFYAGSYLNIEGSDQHDGEFPFAGMFVSERSTGERFWQIRQTSGSHVLSSDGECFDELRLTSGEHWCSYLKGEILEFDSSKHASMSKRFPRFFPGVAVLCLPGGLLVGHSDVGQSGFPYVKEENIVKVTKGLQSMTIVFKVPRTGDWLHIFFDESQGRRPTLSALTKPGLELKEDLSNASILCRARWRKSGSGEWLPEAGENVDFYGANHTSFDVVLRVAYKCLWLGEGDIPATTFLKEDMSSDATSRLKSVSGLFRRIDDVRGIEGL